GVHQRGRHRGPAEANQTANHMNRCPAAFLPIYFHDNIRAVLAAVGAIRRDINRIEMTPHRSLNSLSSAPTILRRPAGSSSAWDDTDPPMNRLRIVSRSRLAEAFARQLSLCEHSPQPAR